MANRHGLWNGIRWVFVLACLSMVFGSADIPAAAQDSGDSRGSGTEEERPLLKVTPPSLLQKSDRETIAKIAEELRAFDAPVAVVVRLIAEPSDATDRAAEELYSEVPVESRPDAADGLLILVEVPRDAHEGTTIGFATGSNFYPRGGITPERLDAIVANEVQPLIDRNNVGDAIVNLMQWIAWVHLFESSPRIERSSNQQTLATALDQVAAPLLIVLSVALIGFAAWTGWSTRRQNDPTPAGDLNAPMDAVYAGALARGRADDAVVTGALLRLLDRGAVAFARPWHKRPDLRLEDRELSQSPTDRRLWDTIASLADPTTGIVSTTGLRQLPDASRWLKLGLERGLMDAGLFDPRARRIDALLVVAALLCGAVAVLLAVPTLVARARFAVGAEALLLVVAVLVFWWSQRRSWTTARGAAVLRSWRGSPANSHEEQLTYELIVRPDRRPDNDFVAIRSGSVSRPFVPANALITTVRHFGRT